MFKYYICMCIFKQKVISCNLINNYYSFFICFCTKRILCIYVFDNNNIFFYLKIIFSRLFQYWRLCLRIVIICEQIKGFNFNWIEKDGFDILILMLIIVFLFKYWNFLFIGRMIIFGGSDGLIVVSSFIIGMIVRVISDYKGVFIINIDVIIRQVSLKVYLFL